MRAVGVVVSHPLSMREALGSIPRLSILSASLMGFRWRVRSTSRCLAQHAIAKARAFESCAMVVRISLVFREAFATRDRFLAISAILFYV